MTSGLSPPDGRRETLQRCASHPPDASIAEAALHTLATVQRRKGTGAGLTQGFREAGPTASDPHALEIVTAAARQNLFAEYHAQTNPMLTAIEDQKEKLAWLFY